MTPVIELQELRVKLGRREILQGISCRLGDSGAGKAIGLLGPNGAGKSTLILTLLGFHKASAGSARILGLDCHSQSREVKARVGYMPENEAFIADMSAVRFLRIMGELSGLPTRVALEKAHEVLFHVGLGEARYRPLGTYSLGMKQMAKLAQAIIHGPELVILDEPTNGLDPAARARMLKLVREMTEQHGMSVVLCSHLLRDVEEVCDEVVILKDGGIVHHANLEEERRANRRFVELEVGGYERYQGALTGQWSRWFVLPRFAWQRLMQQRLVAILFVIATFWPLACAAFVYLSHHAELLQGFGPQASRLLKIDGEFFVVFMNAQSMFAIILSAFAGPSLIAPDLANGALPLYFSRPFTRWEYVSARMLALVGVLSLVTWVPGFLLFTIQWSMAGWSWLGDHWQLASGILLGFPLWILFVGLVALASSAY